LLQKVNVLVHFVIVNYKKKSKGNVFQQKWNFKNNGRKIIHSLAHHDPNRDDFEDHVFYLFNYALCIGCFAFFLGTVTALILGNLFYNYIITYINLPIMATFFFFCWLSSIMQYGFQIIIKKSLKNRSLKFIIRFLYPLGSILFIFITPLLGLILAIPAGYFIIYIRRIKERIFSIQNEEP
jgi:hypothetical protein